MWTRADLKSRAKAGLKNYIWMAVLTGIVSSLVVSFGTGLIGLLALIPIIGWIAAPIMGLIFGAAIGTGVCSYFVKSTRNGADAGLGEIFSGMQKMGTIAGITIFYWLWQLVPIMCIIKRYELYMVYYLASEFPEKSRKEIFQMSKRMMDGNKMNTFILELSFVGWALLGIITCGIGMLFVTPYIKATMAELYLWLKEERLGIPREDTQAVPSPEGLGDIGNYQAPIAQNASAGMIAMESKKGYLVGIQGEFTGANIPIERGEVLKIGRDPAQCNVVVKGTQTSRLHLIVEFDGNAFRVTDQSSLGTFNLQGGQLPKGQAVLLQSGTYLQLGNGGDIFMLECK
ncbi:MAG: DUF975 family protein [Brotaphodocola sp.]